MYKKICPHGQLNFYQQELIEVEVTDTEAWAETLKFWFGNGYREKSVFRMLEYYHERIAERARGRWQDVGRYEGTEPDSKYACTKCCDERKLVHFPNPESIEGMQWIDCPDCLTSPEGEKGSRADTSAMNESRLPALKI